MISNKTLYTGILGTGLGRTGTAVLGSNRIVRVEEYPNITNNSPAYSCIFDAINWVEINQAYLSATTVCLLQTENRLPPKEA